MWDIYYIYWVLSGYIQQYSRLNLGFFFSSSACGLGRKKKFLGFGAILLYIALKNPIYTLHISHLYSAQKMIFFVKMSL